MDQLLESSFPEYAGDMTFLEFASTVHMANRTNSRKRFASPLSPTSLRSSSEYDLIERVWWNETEERKTEKIWPYNLSCVNTQCSSITHPPIVNLQASSVASLESNNVPRIPKVLENRQSESLAAPVPGPLLPSPIIYDRQFNEHLKSRLHVDIMHSLPISGYPSYEDLNILSYYLDQEISPEENLDQDSQIEDIGDSLIADDEGSIESDAFPETPKDKIYRSRSNSHESGWLANTKSHTERLRHFNARCFQVVQHPLDHVVIEDEEQIMVATVLVGPGKPKLIQIQRPSSTSTSIKSIEALERGRRTPADRTTQETSAFSPYDTPGYPEENFQSRKAYSDTNNTSFFLSSLTSSPSNPAIRSRSSSSISSVYKSTVQRLQSLKGPFRRRSSFSFRHQHCQQEAREQSETCMDNSSPSWRATSVKRFQKIERTLEVVKRAIEKFPENTLHPDCPLFRELQCTHVDAETHTRMLRQIFPHANDHRLSELVVWLLTDFHLRKVCGQTISNSDFDLVPRVESTTFIPEKACEKLGISIPEAYSMHLEYNILQNQIQMIQASIIVIAQHIIEGLRGTWHEDIWRMLRVLVVLVENGGEFLS